MAAFSVAHVVELCERLAQTIFQRGAELILLFVRLRQWWRKPADDSGKAQQGNNVEIGLHLHLLTQFFGGVRIRLQQFLVYLHRRGLTRLHVHVDVEMAAVNFFTDDLAQPQFVDVESFGHPEPDIEETMIDALHADAQRPAIGFGARLRVAGHRNAFGFFSAGGLRLRFCWCGVLGHKVVPGTARFRAACMDSSTSSLANCKLCSLAYVPPRAINSECVPLSRICPSSSTRILSARRTVAKRCAMTKVVRPTIKLARAFCTYISDSASSSEVASSRIRIGESFRMARAMAMRWRCPPLSRVPRSPITVS